MVTLKLATSLDGRIATATGESAGSPGRPRGGWPTPCGCPHDAVLVGAGTARADDPDLTARDWAGAANRCAWSRRVGWTSTRGRAGWGGRGRGSDLWLLHGPDATPADRRARMGAGGGEAGPGAGRADRPGRDAGGAGAAGLTRVLCEGGGALAASLLQADLVDELVGFTAGIVLGAEGTPGLGALGLAALSEAPGFALSEVRPCGGDILHRWRAPPPGPGDVG